MVNGIRQQIVDLYVITPIKLFANKLEEIQNFEYDQMIKIRLFGTKARQFMDQCKNRLADLPRILFKILKIDTWRNKLRLVSEERYQRNTTWQELP
jgi:hypothetical protein